MTYNLYTIYDKVSEDSGPVFQAKNFGVAKRYVEDMVKSNPIKLDEKVLSGIMSPSVARAEVEALFDIAHNESLIVKETNLESKYSKKKRGSL